MKYILILLSSLILLSCKKDDDPQPEIAPYETAEGIPRFDQRNKTVTADAKGGGDGSDAHPWTLNEAMTHAVAGDTVGIKAGVYIGENTVKPSSARYTPAFVPKNSGQANAPIVFVAEHQASKVSSGYSEIRSGASLTGAGWPAFGCYQKDHVYWVGLFSDENTSNNKGAADSAPCIMWSCKGGAIIACKITGEAVNYIDNHSAIRLENVTNIRVSDNQLSGFNKNAKNSVNQAGIITYDVQFCTIEFNAIFNCGTAIQIKGYEHYGFKIRYNAFYDNLFSTIRAHGFSEGPNKERSRIYQNLFFNNAQEFEFTSSGTIGTRGVEALDIFNNSIYAENGTIATALLWLTDQNEQHNNTLFNNAIHIKNKRAYFYAETASTSAEHFTAYIKPNYNCYYGALSHGDGTSSSNWDQIDFSSWQALTHTDANSIVADPLFSKPTPQNLQLSANSPCLNAGKDLGQLLGNNTSAAINIGAYISSDQSETFGVR